MRNAKEVKEKGVGKEKRAKEKEWRFYRRKRGRSGKENRVKEK